MDSLSQYCLGAEQSDRSPEDQRLSLGTRIPGVAELWRETSGSRQVCIALLDGAMDHSHPALQGAGITQHDVLGRAADSGTVSREHGTFVASIIFGRHDGPLKGIAPNCRGLLIPIYSEDGLRVSCSQKDLAKAINEAIRLGAHVINISGGELATNGSASEDLRLAIRNCIHHDRVIVAAAGNDGCRECLHVPGALPSVLAVGAMDWSGEPLASSNWGEIYRLQGVLAPGQDIPGAIPSRNVDFRSGSSFAAAIVSGVFGLLLSLQKKRGEKPNPFLVREALLRTADRCGASVSTTCDRFLAGRLNIRRAIQFFQTGGQSMASNIRSQGCTEIPEEQGSSPTEAVNMDDTDQSTDSSVSDSPQSCAQTHGRLVNTSSRDFEPSGTIMPSSGCGCQGTVRQKVYAIGELDIDLVSPARRDSIQANAPRLPPMFGFDASIENRFTFLRYLLGIDFKPEAGIGDEMRAAIDEARRGALVNGNFYDAASVIWVLKQGECPMYAIKPQGAFAEAAYRQLVIFLIEQTFRNYQEFTQQGVSEHCLDEFYNCFGGTQQPFRDSLSRPETVSLTQGAQDEGGGSPPQTRRRRGKDEAEQDGEAGRSPAAGGTRTADVINRAFDLYSMSLTPARHTLRLRAR